MSVLEMTEAATGTLEAIASIVAIVFNSQTWIAVDTNFTVDGEALMLASDLNIRLLADQIAPPLVLTITAAGGPFIGACTYKTGTVSTTDSTVLKKGGVFVVHQTTWTFDCIVTVQPVNLVPTPHPDFTIGTAIPCDYTFISDQSKLKST